MLTFKTRIFAHRGLHGAQDEAPENSMEAFRRAAERGLGIELDIQFSSDRQIVVFHDTGLSRVCGVCGKVSDYTYEELQAFPLQRSGERIPLLSDVLELVDGRVPLIVELKTPGNRFDPRLCRDAARMLDRYRGEYCIEAFHPLVLLWFRLMRPAVRRGQLCTDYIRTKGAGPAYLLLQTQVTNLLTWPDFIAFDFHFRGDPFFRFWKRFSTPVAWTLRSPEDFEAARKDFDFFVAESAMSSD